MTSRGGNRYLLTSALFALTVIYVASVEAKLKHVHVLFRHGDRTPDNNGFEMYPNDPYLNFSFYPTGLGQLTKNGKSREFQLGKVLRDRYDEFLGKIYTPNTVFALSSDYDRTKMSLQLVCASLFPPADSQRWNEDLNWQPVPARYIPRVKDNLFLPDECPLYLAEYNRVLNSPEIQKDFSSLDDVKEKLTELTGKNISTPLDFFYLYHTFVAEASMGLPLPNWAYDVFPYGALYDGIIYAYQIGSATPLLKRLYGGPFLRIVTENMKDARNGSLKDPKQIYLYSGHETNIASVLSALDLYEPHVPEYSSAIFLELHQFRNRYFVKILHYLGIPPVVTELKLKGCEALCPLDKFLELTADLIPSDEELDCDKTKTPDYANHRPSSATNLLTFNLINAAK